MFTLPYGGPWIAVENRHGSDTWQRTRFPFPARLIWISLLKSTHYENMSDIEPPQDAILYRHLYRYIASYLLTDMSC
jgi:hypothetical protein